MIDIEACEKFLIAFQTFLEHIMLKPRDWALSDYLESIGEISFTPSVDTLIRRYERSYGDTVIDLSLSPMMLLAMKQHSVRVALF